jgi:cytochrome P450
MYASVHAPAIEELSLNDVLRPEILSDPYPLYERLRTEDPVHWDTVRQEWIASRYDEVRFILADPRFSSALLIPPQSGDGDAVMAALSRQVLFLDPPDHGRLRALMGRGFTPHRIEILRPRIAAMVTEILDSAEKARGLDLVGDLAIPLPVSVIAEMLGVPVKDRAQMRAWSICFGLLLGGRPLLPDESKDAYLGIIAFTEYFRELVTERRRHPTGDMISTLAAVEEPGDVLSSDELLANLILLLAAGHGTTTRLLGNGVFALLRQRDQWRLICDDPSLVHGAIRELLRFECPVQTTTRVALESVDLCGKRIEARQRVTVLLGSANRDALHFPDPESLLVRRSGVAPLTFGHGVHICLGAALARVEGEEVIGALARRFPDMRLESETQRWVPNIAFRGLESLPLRLS